MIQMVDKKKGRKQIEIQIETVKIEMEKKNRAIEQKSLDKQLSKEEEASLASFNGHQYPSADELGEIILLL